jgi:RHS repeat-associated protein
MGIKEREWSDSTFSYRFGFNGMEQDDEVKGNGNSLDFGARIYDSRLGRFMSMDPMSRQFPFLTPFCFAANNPIRLIDSKGENPDDPVIFQKVNGKGSVLVYLVDDGSDFDLHWYTDDDQWDIVVVTNLASAAEILDKTYGSTKKINNMVVRTHGTLSGGKLVIDNTTGKHKTGDMSRREFISANDLENPQGEKETKAVDDLKGIFKHVGENADILFTACNLASDGGIRSDIGHSLVDLILTSAKTTQVNVFANMEATSSTSQNAGGRGIDRFRWDLQLTTSENFNSGWVQFTSSIEDGTSMGLQVPIVDDDELEIQWENTENTTAIETSEETTESSDTTTTKKP